MRISKRTIDVLLPKGERYEVWDDNLIGFGVRIGTGGQKTFICRYRNRGMRRHVKLGRYGAITPEEARNAAKKVLGSVALGGDPALEKEEVRSAIKFAKLVELFFEEHGPKLKPRTRDGYQHSLDKHVLPSLGKFPIELITLRELNKIHINLAGTPYAANRVISSISSVFSWAESNGYLPKGKNPAWKLKRFKEQARQRYLSNDELERLGAVLIQAETVGLSWRITAAGTNAKHVPQSNQSVLYPSHVVDAIRLLLLTGCRLREILHLKWNEVDLGRGLLFLRDSKTGQKTVILNRAAIAILDNMQVAGNFVIPGKDPDQARHDLKRPWDHIRAAAEIPDVRLHDLRHTHASVGAAAGFGLPIVGRLLGHASSATTQRYAHIADDPARRASDAIGVVLQNALIGNLGAGTKTNQFHKAGS